MKLTADNQIPIKSVFAGLKPTARSRKFMGLNSHCSCLPLQLRRSAASSPSSPVPSHFLDLLHSTSAPPPTPTMASPRRRSLPLRFLIFIPVPLFLVLLLFHRSSHPTAPLLHSAGSGSGPSPDPSRFSLLIKLLAYDRPAAFRRCLRSLAAADYDGDRVALHVLLDHRTTNSSVTPLAASHEILDFVDAFPWPHGEKRVHYRAANAGLQAQWIEAWWPGSDDEFAFVVEDDLQVSPLYYRFLKRVVMRYYYDRENYSPYVFGASLQRPRFVAGESLFNRI